MSEHKGLEDYIIRTMRNLEKIEEDNGKIPEKYEVTQLINSLLGIVVFPAETIRPKLPQTLPDELLESGWPLALLQSNIDGSRHDLSSTIVFLRHAVSHHNIELLSDTDGQISGLKLWNYPIGSQTKNWEISIRVEDMRASVVKIAEVSLKILENSTR